MNLRTCIITAVLFTASAVGDLSAAPPRKASGPWNPTTRSTAPATINPAPLQGRRAAALFAEARGAVASSRAPRNDVDGDGRSDLIWNTIDRDNYFGVSAYRLAYWRMDGANVLSKHSYEISTNFTNVASGDFDGDGRTDILFTTVDGTSPERRVFMWRSRGDASFETYSLGSVPKAWSVASLSVVADINGDGRDDIIWQNRNTGQGAYWLMNGASVIGSSVFGVHSDCRLRGAGDFDGDGRTDLMCNLSSKLYILRNTGDGAFTTSLMAIYDGSWNIAGNADMNGDGRTDIVWNYESQSMMGFWWLDGMNVVRQDSRWIGRGSYSLGVGDFDGDGLGDVTSLQLIDGHYYVLLWRSRGDGSFDIQLVGESAAMWIFMGNY